MPANLTINWSAWAGVEIPAVVSILGLGICYVQDGIEDRIPANARKCPGTGCAETCKMCMHNSITARPIYFPVH